MDNVYPMVHWTLFVLFWCYIGCPICLEKYPINPVKMPCCQQILCKACSDRVFQTTPYCSICRTPLRAVVGNQPANATMNHSVSSILSLPGYPGVGTIIIKYRVPDGTQTREHPNPGRRYSGTTRTAYLPNSAEGREVLQLLRRAFKARLIFTIGTLHTSGLSDVVTWNDIHHKTTNLGESWVSPVVCSCKNLLGSSKYHSHFSSLTIKKYGVAL